MLVIIVGEYELTVLPVKNSIKNFWLITPRDLSFRWLSIEAENYIVTISDIMYFAFKQSF